MEFLARVEALARRSDTVIKETVLRVGDLELDLVSRSASRRGRDISLLPREFQLLEYLVRNEGQVVSRAMLLQHVWIFILIRRLTSLTSMLGVSAARSMGSKFIHSSTQFVALGIASVHLVETLRSSTFRLALIAIGFFGSNRAYSFRLCLFVDSFYVRSQSDSAIKAEQGSLQRVYNRAGRGGLVAMILAKDF